MSVDYYYYRYPINIIGLLTQFQNKRKRKVRYRTLLHRHDLFANPPSEEVNERTYIFRQLILLTVTINFGK